MGNARRLALAAATYVLESQLSVNSTKNGARESAVLVGHCNVRDYFVLSNSNSIVLVPSPSYSTVICFWPSGVDSNTTLALVRP